MLAKYYSRHLDTHPCQTHQTRNHVKVLEVHDYEDSESTEICSCALQSPVIAVQSCRASVLESQLALYLAVRIGLGCSL